MYLPVYRRGRGYTSGRTQSANQAGTTLDCHRPRQCWSTVGAVGLSHTPAADILLARFLLRRVAFSETRYSACVPSPLGRASHFCCCCTTNRWLPRKLSGEGRPSRCGSSVLPLQYSCRTKALTVLHVSCRWPWTRRTDSTRATTWAMPGATANAPSNRCASESASCGTVKQREADKGPRPPQASAVSWAGMDAPPLSSSSSASSSTA